MFLRLCTSLFSWPSHALASACLPFIACGPSVSTRDPRYLWVWYVPFRYLWVPNHPPSSSPSLTGASEAFWSPQRPCFLDGFRMKLRSHFWMALGVLSGACRGFSECMQPLWASEIIRTLLHLSSDGVRRVGTPLKTMDLTICSFSYPWGSWNEKPPLIIRTKCKKQNVL